MGDWTINGKTGTAGWSNGARSQLTIERFDSTGVLIRRQDLTIPAFTAVYQGTIHGNYILGDVVWKWAGHWNNQPVPGKWSATILGAVWPTASSPDAESMRNLPDVMHFCALNCMSLYRDNTHYVVKTSGTETDNDGSIWTVESFTRESVIIDRADSTGFGAVYKGQISPDGIRLINITVNGTPMPNIRWTWGTALNLTPGNNEERDR